jgi:hypothetical protein
MRLLMSCLPKGSVIVVDGLRRRPSAVGRRGRCGECSPPLCQFLLGPVGADGTEVNKAEVALDTTTGSYDDMLVWVPVGVLYAKLLAGGVLP